jgi:hypothetical protein
VKAFVIFRDRVTYGRPCVTALQSAGLDVVIADHGTTHPEALAWLQDLQRAGTPVMYCGAGHHPRDLWNHNWFRDMCGPGQYIVTDPDVIPSDDCPPDWPEHLARVLDAHPGCHKAGLGLRTDRIPARYPRRERVIEWERQFWQQDAGDGAYHAPVDTTLALHVPLEQQGMHSFAAVRTGHPYVADHLAWYENHDNLPDDLCHYHEHAESGISFWTLAGRSAWGD